MLRQLTLLDMRPICPACKEVAGYLGQWSPSGRVFICKDCTLKYPAPDVFVLNDNSIGLGLLQGDSQEERAMRDDYHKIYNVLFDLNRGCVMTLEDAVNNTNPAWHLPCDKLTGTEEFSNCKLCRRRASVANAGLAGGKYKHLASIKTYTLSMPVCQRCGQIHGNRYKHINEYQAYCAHCDAKNSVEAFWRHKGIFGDADDETILDRMQISHPEAFKLGVLPDYWFELRIKEKMK